MSAGNRKHPHRAAKPIHVQKTEFYHYVAFAFVIILFAALLSYLIR